MPIVWFCVLYDEFAIFKANVLETANLEPSYTDVLVDNVSTNYSYYYTLMYFIPHFAYYRFGLVWFGFMVLVLSLVTLVSYLM